MYPASSVQVVRIIVTQFQASINSLKESGVEIKPQMEESMENLQLLMRHLQERSKEGTLRSDKDTYALLHNMGADPGKILFCSYQFSMTHHFQSFLKVRDQKDQFCFSLTPAQKTSKISELYPSTPHLRSSTWTSGPSSDPTSPPSAIQTPTSTLTRTSACSERTLCARSAMESSKFSITRWEGEINF